jgi:hypothetical protein
MLEQIGWSRPCSLFNAGADRLEPTMLAFYAGADRLEPTML